jgi:hypothetical protein
VIVIADIVVGGVVADVGLRKTMRYAGPGVT